MYPNIMYPNIMYPDIMYPDIMYLNIMYLDIISEPQLPGLQTAIYHMGLDVEKKVTQCAGHVYANTKLHQLRWGDQEWVYYMSYTHI